MSPDYVLLWGLVVIDTLVLLLLARQVAPLVGHARPEQVQGPGRGSVVPEWSMQSVISAATRSSDMLQRYALLFVADTCKPCHVLFGELQALARRPPVPVFVVAQGGVNLLLEEAGEHGPFYEDVIAGDLGELRQRMQIPGTPWAIGVADRRVVDSGAVPTAEALFRVCRTAAEA